MKKHVLLVFVFLSLNAFAQFPSPSAFQFSYIYYNIYNSGPCGGQYIYGPTYCSYFNWVTPDTSGVTATFDHYNLYYHDFYNNNDTNLIASVIDTFYVAEGGFVGEMWVTAVYLNPSGESGPSNIEVNNSLPISIKETASSQEVSIISNSELKVISLTHVEELKEFRIFNLQGCQLMAGIVNNRILNVEKLPFGLYIIEINTKENKLIRKKLII